jgi:hypothetical protein
MYYIIVPRLCTLIILILSYIATIENVHAQCDNGVNLANIVHILKQDFGLANNAGTGNGSGTYNPPIFDDVSDPNTLNQAKALVNDVYPIAPSFFQSALCDLDYIIVDPFTSPVGWGGWGFWENSDQPPSPSSLKRRTFIGITKKVVQDYSASTPAPTVTTLEGYNLGLIGGVPLSSWPNPPYYSATVNDAKTAMLGLLAHEMGHIFYRDGTRFTKCFDVTWHTHGGQEKRFHKFGVPFKHSRPEGSVDATNIINDLKSLPNFDDALTDLDTLMGNNNGKLNSLSWASALATIAPDEDFAETLRLMVLYKANPPVKDLTIKIPVPSASGYAASTYYISAQLVTSGQNLNSKAICFAKALAWSTFP